jgi:hypothetical protein
LAARGEFRYTTEAYFNLIPGKDRAIPKSSMDPAPVGMSAAFAAA